MTKHNAKERPRSRAKASSRSFVYGLVAAIAIIIAGFLYWPQLEPRLTEFRNAVIGARQATDPSPPAPETAEKKQAAQHSADKTPPALTGDKGSTQDATAVDTPPSVQEPAGDEVPGPGVSPKDADPQQLVDELNTFYAYLDQQAYMRDFGLQEPSKVHFSKLLQKLMDNPPVVVRETDDILTLLKNTAHFYRILDQDNIMILKGILDRDRKSFEQILKAFYTLTYHPEYLKKEYSLTLPQDALRDYAAFFLNTIGGRLYLFRRDSASRMTVSYYAILVIDKANEEGNNPHGIDVRPAIDSLIDEIENSGKSLKFRDEYLNNLYDLKEKYN